MNEYKNRVITTLKNYLAECPEDTKEFLDIISDSLVAFIGAQKKKHDKLSLAAVTELTFFIERIEPNMVVYYLNTFVYKFPNGWESVKGECIAVLKAFYKFVIAAKEYDLAAQKEWLRNIRNQLWWVDLIFNCEDFNENFAWLEAAVKDK